MPRVSTKFVAKIQFTDASALKAGVQQLAIIIKNATGRAHLLGPQEVQKIAENIWQSVSNYLFDHRGRPRFKSRRRGVHSICGKVCAGMHLNQKGELVRTFGDIDWDGERHLLKWRGRELVRQAT